MKFHPKQLNLNKDFCMTGGTVMLSSGTASKPGLRFCDHANTGMFLAGPSKIGFSTSGSLKLFINTVSITSNVQVRVPQGSSDAPGISFDSATRTGLFVDKDKLQSVVDGNIALSLSSNGDLKLQGSGATTLQTGTTLQRPSGVDGMIRYNSDSKAVEFFANKVWRSVSAGSVLGTTNQIKVATDANSGNNIVSLEANPVLPGNGSVTVPAGTTAQKPTTPLNGAIRYNSDVASFEFRQNNNWETFVTNKSLNNAVQRTWFNTIPSQAISNAIVLYQYSAPTINQGVEIWKMSLNPLSVDSNFYIMSNIDLDSSGNDRDITVFIFRNQTCIGAATVNIYKTGKPQISTIIVNDEPNTTSTVTYSARICSDYSTTIYINRSYVSSSYWGGACAQKGYLIMEH